MKTYEYKILKDPYTLEDINKLGQEGWKIAWTKIDSDFKELTLLEREIVKE